MKTIDYWIGAYASYLPSDPKAKTCEHLHKWIADIQKDAYEAGKADGLEESVEIVYRKSPMALD